MQRLQAKAGHQDASLRKRVWRSMYRVGTRPTTQNMFGGPQMSAISHHMGIISPLDGNIWQLGGIPSPCQVVFPLCTSPCSPRPSPAQQPSANRIAVGGEDIRTHAAGVKSNLAFAGDPCAAAGRQGSYRPAANRGAHPIATAGHYLNLCAAAGGEGSSRHAAGKRATPSATGTGGAKL
ncbi:hypothetical protein QJQ45_028880 [Haematococcus lacustris]|nr:hypothetical protein QJQ45_028880 [Haematococcus lacustris]